MGIPFKAERKVTLAGREYSLKFNIGAAARFEERTGKTVPQVLDSAESIGFYHLTELASASLMKAHPGMTAPRVQALLEEDFGAYSALQEALWGAVGECYQRAAEQAQKELEAAQDEGTKEVP